MHTLAALNEPGQSFVGGVRFAMMDGPVRVVCWVTREALEAIERGNPSQQDCMGCFERHRLKIEQLASKKYDGGEQSPIVMTFDFGPNTHHNQREEKGRNGERGQEPTRT
jgi:hypothetical protein